MYQIQSSNTGKMKAYLQRRMEFLHLEFGLGSHLSREKVRKKQAKAGVILQRSQSTSPYGIWPKVPHEAIKILSIFSMAQLCSETMGLLTPFQFRIDSVLWYQAGTHRAALWDASHDRFTKWIFWSTVIAIWDALLPYGGFNGELRAALTFKYPTHSKAALDDFTPIIY